MSMTNAQQVAKHFERYEEDFGIYAFMCRHCSDCFESDSSSAELWLHIRNQHSAELGDWAKPAGL